MNSQMNHHCLWHSHDSPNSLFSMSILMMTTCSCISIWLFFWSNMFLKLVWCETWSTIRLIFWNDNSVVLCFSFKLFNSINGCASGKETLKFYIYVTSCCINKNASTFEWFWWINYLCVWLFISNTLTFKLSASCWAHKIMKICCPGWSFSANSIPAHSSITHVPFPGTVQFVCFQIDMPPI